MVRALGGVGVLCSLLIVFAFQATLPTIERKKAEELERAIFRVLPEATRRESFRLGDEERELYAGYDEESRLVGVAIEARGQGFQDTIRLLYGYSPPDEDIVGMVVLDSKETPGLGDKILKDADFLANFAALDVSLTSDGEALRNPIEVVKHGTKTEAWQIDGITGATISSQAIGRILQTSAEETLPRLSPKLDELQRGTE
jgi:electron transport complex protein RnfG